MIGGWLQAGRRADRAVHICGETAAAADDVMVIVSDSRLIPCRMAGRLDTADKPRFLQDVQVVIHCLGGERTEPFAGGVCDRFRIPMLSLAHHGSKDGKPRRGHPQACLTKGYVKCGSVRYHMRYYRLLSGMSQ